jgi:hypothetical protein
LAWAAANHAGLLYAPLLRLGLQAAASLAAAAADLQYSMFINGLPTPTSGAAMRCLACETGEKSTVFTLSTGKCEVFDIFHASSDADFSALVPLFDLLAAAAAL